MFQTNLCFQTCSSSLLKGLLCPTSPKNGCSKKQPLISLLVLILKRPECGGPENGRQWGVRTGFSVGGYVKFCISGRSSSTRLAKGKHTVHCLPPHCMDKRGQGAAPATALSDPPSCHYSHAQFRGLTAPLVADSPGTLG